MANEWIKKLKKENSNQGKKNKTYSQRMKSFSKINTLYFILKQKREKGGVTENLNYNMVNTFQIAIEHVSR